MIAETPRSLFRKYRTIIVLLVVLGVLTAGVFGILSKLYHGTGNNNTGVNPSTRQTEVLNYAAQLDRESNYGEEAKVLQNYLKTDPPKKYRYQPLMILGNLVYDNRHYVQAIAYYRQAEAAAGKVQLVDAASIATAAQAAGQNQLAIEYYREAIKLTPVQPGVANSISDYQDAIKYLGGTP